MDDITYTPIGRVHSPFDTPGDVVHEAVDDTEGRVGGLSESVLGRQRVEDLAADTRGFEERPVGRGSDDEPRRDRQPGCCEFAQRGRLPTDRVEIGRPRSSIQRTVMVRVVD